MRTIVVGYDGSDSARRALGRAADLSEEGATILVMHATPSVYPKPYEVVDPEEETRSEILLEEAKELLAKRGVAAETRSPVGDPAEHLIAAARAAQADVIVVGRRRSTISHLLGSVSSKVVEHSACDVLVVR